MHGEWWSAPQLSGCIPLAAARHGRRSFSPRSRQQLAQLQRGTLQDSDEVGSIPLGDSAGQRLYLRSYADRVVLIFPIASADFHDCVMLAALVQVRAPALARGLPQLRPVVCCCSSKLQGQPTVDTSCACAGGRWQEFASAKSVLSGDYPQAAYWQQLVRAPCSVFTQRARCALILPPAAELDSGRRAAPRPRRSQAAAQPRRYQQQHPHNTDNP